MNDCQPKCDSCVDAYNSECHCQKSVYYGMALEQVPWTGCPCFLSQRKWSVHDKPKKKRRKNIRAWRNLSSECNLKLFDYGKE